LTGLSARTGTGLLPVKLGKATHVPKDARNFFDFATTDGCHKYNHLILLIVPQGTKS